MAEVGTREGRASSSDTLTLESVRVRLEGRFEVLERARDAYDVLEEQARTLARLVSCEEPLRAAAEMEGRVWEALEHTERRARQEEWPADSEPARALV